MLTSWVLSRSRSRSRSLSLSVYIRISFSFIFPVNIFCAIFHHPYYINKYSNVECVLLAKTKINNPIDIYLIIRTAKKRTFDIFSSCTRGKRKKNTETQNKRIIEIYKTDFHVVLLIIFSSLSLLFPLLLFSFHPLLFAHIITSQQLSHSTSGANDESTYIESEFDHNL